MRITKKFLSLTKKTYPHGTEQGLLHFLPKGYLEDEFGNYYLKIGDKPTTMFTCHLDTADYIQTKVNHILKDNFVYTDGTSILGADDKAGMTVILYLIEKQVPGLYYFFIGEEVGCIGSRALSNRWKTTEFSKYINKCVSFDRRGTTSVITYQFGGRCCSDEFGLNLANELNKSNGLQMKLDDTGILTDSAQFVDIIPECTNISVGYYNEHTSKERQDILFLQKLCFAASKVDWEGLVIKRDPNTPDFYHDDYDDLNDYMSKNKISDSDWDEDNYCYVKLRGKTKKVYLKNNQIEYEKGLIYDYLSKSSNYYDNVTSILWNGFKLSYLNKKGYIEEIGDRMALIDFVPDLAQIPEINIREDRPKAKTRSGIDGSLWNMLL